jgi:very-short-patch-repair endonuclease
MSPSIERAIAERAQTQLGLLTRPQLVAQGLSRHTVRRWVLAGRLVPIGTRTYRLAGVPPSRRGDVMAACLDVGAVASHRTAAWLHGLGERPPLVDVTVAKGRRTDLAAPPGCRIHTSTNLTPDDVVPVGPIPTTSVARTLLGLAALPEHEISTGHLTDVVERAVADRLASDRWLWWLLEQRRCRGRDGVVRFEGVLADRARLGPTESWLERELLAVLDAARLPRPTTQRVVRRRGRFVARVDVVYDDRRLVIEALGYASRRTREEQTADLRRENELRRLGYEVLPFTYDHIVRDPTWVAATVADRLLSCAA